MMDHQNAKLRDDMMQIYGMLSAICFPIVWTVSDNSVAYYDLIDSILERYKSVLKRLFQGLEID